MSACVASRRAAPRSPSALTAPGTRGTTNVLALSARGATAAGPPGGALPHVEGPTPAASPDGPVAAVARARAVPGDLVAASVIRLHGDLGGGAVGERSAGFEKWVYAQWRTRGGI